MPIRWAYLKRVFAGAVFGLYMAHLLYFLNPQIDITAARLVIVTIAYGAICGLLFGTALWILRALRVKLFGRPGAEGEYRTHGFGFVVLAAMAAALIYYIHLEAVRIYLPVGAVRILSKATTVITATAFILLLLWVLERNADRRTSRAILGIGVLLIAISSFLMYQRRESYRTDRRHVVEANVGTVAGRKPVLVVAIRNLPYDWILTMSGEGLLPFFDSAMRNSYVTRLEPFKTTSPKALWASLATGKLPYRHGVTGRFSYRTLLNGSDPEERFLLVPSGVGFRAWGLIPPVQRISAPLPAGDALPLWSLFERLGFRASVVNWPQSQQRGATRVVTDRVLRTRAGSAAEIGPSVERFTGTGDARQRIVNGLAGDLRAARLQSGGEFDLRVVALEGFSEAQRALHIFTDELPAATSMKGDALRAYAQQLDRIVGALAREHPDHLVVVCSPTAIVHPELPTTPYAVARDVLLPGDPGADDGFVLVAGPGVARGVNPPPAYVVDVVPTVLFAAGLPVGRDMDGSVITAAFDEEFLRRSTLAAIQTYEAQQLVVKRGR